MIPTSFKQTLLRLQLVFVLLIVFISIHGQQKINFVPAPVQDTIPASVLQALKAKLEADKAQITAPEPQVRAQVKKMYDERFAYVVQQFNDDYFITDSRLTSYLQSILASIYKSNPQLSPEATVYAYRSTVPNAMSFGEGTIAFTLGLLERMENEDQIAFVLCHELAHYHARHSDIKALQLARLNEDKEIRKKVKDISRSEYGRFTRFSKLMQGLGLSINKHSREKEFEADSLALLLYTNTVYDVHAAIRTLEILDSADISKHKSNIDFKRHFNFNEYPFKEQWLNYSKSETWYARQGDLENDSMHTHPSCKKRIVALNRQLQVAEVKPLTKKNTSDSYSKSIRPYIGFEMIESSYHFKHYGAALFSSLLSVQNNPDQVYLHAMIGKCLYQLYWYQKNHELSKVLLLPDPRLDENYDRYLTFIHQLRLLEIASLGYYYINDKKEVYSGDEDFLYARWMCSAIEVSKEDPNAIKREYLGRFPSGRYALQLNSK